MINIVLSLFDKDGQFRKLIANLNGQNFAKGFPDYILTLNGLPKAVVEEKRKSLDEITFFQMLWLNWFKENLVTPYIYLSQNKQLICLHDLASKLTLNQNPIQIQISPNGNTKHLSPASTPINLQIKSKWRKPSGRGKPKISEEMTEAILTLRNLGFTYREIALKLEISQMTAYRYHKAYKNNVTNKR